MLLNDLQALIVAHERRGQYQEILSSTRGVVFFGVPHSGSDGAFWANYTVQLVEKASIGFRGNSYFTEILKSHSPEFANISRQFVERGMNLHIQTFYETETMGNLLVGGTKYMESFPC